MIQESKRTIHPVMLAAGVALIVVCGAGTAAIMGWLPNSMAHTNGNTEIATANQPASENSNHSSNSTRSNSAPMRSAANERADCVDCGVVESVRAVETRGQGSGAGAVGGAVVGGILGHQVGGGRGKDAMTVVGALGGAFAGNQIEKSARSTTSYETAVHMDNGTDRSIHSATQPAWQSGDHVKVIDGEIRSI